MNRFTHQTCPHEREKHFNSYAHVGVYIMVTGNSIQRDDMCGPWICHPWPPGAWNRHTYIPVRRKNHFASCLRLRCESTFPGGVQHASQFVSYVSSWATTKFKHFLSMQSLVTYLHIVATMQILSDSACMFRERFPSADKRKPTQQHLTKLHSEWSRAAHFCCKNKTR